MDEIISSGRELSIYDRRRDKDRRRVIKGARTSDNRDEVVKNREKRFYFYFFFSRNPPTGPRYCQTDVAA